MNNIANEYLFKSIYYIYTVHSSFHDHELNVIFTLLQPILEFFKVSKVKLKKKSHRAGVTHTLL